MSSFISIFKYKPGALLVWREMCSPPFQFKIMFIYLLLLTLSTFSTKRFYFSLKKRKKKAECRGVWPKWKWGIICQIQTGCISVPKPKTFILSAYRASVHQWFCQILPDRTPILWRSWPSRPPCAESPTQQERRSEVKRDSSHTALRRAVLDESLSVAPLVAELK